MQHAVATRRQFGVVCDQDQRCAVLTGQAQHQIKHAIGIAAVEIARGLGGQNTSGFGHLCASNGHALTLAA